MTYEGSTTYPGCWETVTWIVMNKPIYISRPEMNALKQLMQGTCLLNYNIEFSLAFSKNLRVDHWLYPYKNIETQNIRKKYTFYLR